MSTKLYPYTTPGNYTYDSNKISIDGGIASLKEDLTNVYARYHLNESSDSNVPDSSGNGRDGTTVNMDDSDWVAGKLNNCLDFDGVNDYVNCGNIAGFEKNEPFSLECWFKTGGTNHVIVSKNTSSSGSGYYIITAVGKIYYRLQNTVSARISVSTVEAGFNNNVWHHLICTYDGLEDASGCHIYIDGIDKAVSIDTNTLSGTITNVSNFNIGNISNLTYHFGGKLDEVVIYDKELTQVEVTYRYNSGNGRESFKYSSDKPTIEPTTLFDPVTVSSWDSFLETLGGGNEGSIGYNLYKVDKANKYYWNGSAWAIGGSESNYNSQAVINTNIGTFDATPDKIGFIAYLISDGDQIVELDENQITYTVNFLPLVNAGSNKSCKDNDTIAPFSDCTFSDPDGTVIKAEYKVDG